jgi:hypothetical protein
MPFTDVGGSLAPAGLLLDESSGATPDETQWTGFAATRGNNRKRMKFIELQRVFAKEGVHHRK